MAPAANRFGAAPRDRWIHVHRMDTPAFHKTATATSTAKVGWVQASHAASLWRAHRRRGPAATQSRRRPDPAAAHHPPSPRVPWLPSSPLQWLALRPSPPQPLSRSSSTGGMLTRLSSPHRLLVTVGRIPIHHAAAAAIKPASKGLAPVSTWQWQPAQASQQLCG